MSNELIDELTSRLQPVARLPGAGRRAIVFAGGALASVAAALTFGHLRADLLFKLSEPAYLSETGLLAVLFASGTLAALRSGVPGARLHLLGPLIGAATAAWLLLLGANALDGSGVLDLAGGLACLCRTLSLTLVPACTLGLMVRRAAPLDGAVSGSLALTAAAALAVLGTRMICSKDEAVHALAWHVAPVAVLALAGWLAGPALMTRKGRQHR